MSEGFRDLAERLGWLVDAERGQRVGAARLVVSTEKISVQLPMDDHIAAALGMSGGVGRIASVRYSSDGSPGRHRPQPGSAL